MVAKVASKLRRAQKRRARAHDRYKRGQKLQCQRCSWEWRSRIKGAVQKCPNCSSKGWDAPYIYKTYGGQPHFLLGKHGVLPKPKPKVPLTPPVPTVPEDSPLLKLLVEGPAEEEER